MADHVVILTANEKELLTLSTTATGGQQVLIHRLQRGLRKGPNDTWLLTVKDSDLPRIARYWYKTGGKPGKGGYQRRYPIRALRNVLPSMAPLFADGSVAQPVKPWVYFKQQKFGDGRIKIGHGNTRRAKGGFSTDNPNELVVLLRIRETDERTERYYQKQFERVRVRDTQEWFWPDDELLAFIHETAAEQKLSEQRCRDDASLVG